MQSPPNMTNPKLSSLPWAFGRENKPLSDPVAGLEQIPETLPQSVKAQRAEGWLSQGPPLPLPPPPVGADARTCHSGDIV